MTWTEMAYISLIQAGIPYETIVTDVSRLTQKPDIDPNLLWKIGSYAATAIAGGVAGAFLLNAADKDLEKQLEGANLRSDEIQTIRNTDRTVGFAAGALGGIMARAVMEMLIVSLKEIAG